MKTTELQGAALDWAVAKCEGLEVYFEGGTVCLVGQPFDTYWKYWNPTTDWAQGGPIIQRERIATWGDGDLYWEAECGWAWAKGPTPLIAAMRCYVASQLGDDVEIPEGLI